MHISGKDLLIGITIEDIEDLATQNSSLRGYLQGYIAEMFLKKKLDILPGIENVSKIRDQDEKKGDFQFNYKGQELTIELKSMITRTVREDSLNGGFSAQVQVCLSDSQLTDDGRRTCCLERGQFDILAVSAFAVGKGWDFYFIANKYLPSSADHPDRLRSSFTLNTMNTPFLHTDLLEVLEDLVN